MLTTASLFGPRARPLRTNHATATVTVQRVLAASSTVAVQQCQQTREFRFGSWFSHLDSEVQEEIKRRQQAFKHKYADQLSRRLNWDKHPLADDARHAVKRMMASYWISHDSRPCGRSDEPEASKQRTPDNKDGSRPGQNIEDVERGAMEHLMFGEGIDGSMRGQKPKRKRGGKKNKHDFVPHTSYGVPEHDDYFIDPVTNRKVAKHPPSGTSDGGVDIPVKTFRNSKMHYSSRQASCKPSGLRSSNESRSAPEYETLLDYMRQKYAEPQDPKSEYDDLHKYKPVTEDGQVSSERTQDLDNDLDNDKPVTGKANVQFEDLKPPYEDLRNYNAAVVDDMVARLESDEHSYSTRNRDDPVFEPEGSPRKDAVPKHNDLDEARSEFPVDTTAKETQDFPIQEDLDRYRSDEFQGKPLGHQIRIGEGGDPVEYRPLIEDLEPGDFPSSTLEQLREKYGTAELRKYTTVGFVEPEGNFSSSAEERVAGEATKKFDSEETTQYKPVYHNEPDGNPLPTADERVVEDLTKRYDPEELAKYTPIYWNEPDGQPAAAQDSRVAEGLTKEYDPAELSEYKPVYWNEPDGQSPTAAKEPSEKYTDLDQYGSIGYQQADGHPTGQAGSVQDGLEDMDARREYESADRLASEDLDRADEPSAEVLRKMSKGQQIDEDYGDVRRRQMMEQQMRKYQTASDATDYEASLAVKNIRARAANAESERQLTGNYVRDFPEEFDKSWTETLSSVPPETVQPNDEFVLESQNMDGGLEGAFGRPSPAKVQPALDRHLDDHPHTTKTDWMVGSEDSGPSATQDSNTVHAVESGDTPMSPAYRKPHEDVSALADKASEATTPGTIYRGATNEPTLYKILAYDPTMQKIETAETSSFVPDTASALTPADALLRLSHPTRFFPHFAPLQAEGYEIISGTGDVLVFRKVRPETSKEKPAERHSVQDQSAPTADESGTVETRINPIDMTGRPRFSPASANFASPTGYVNYDNIPETRTSKLPPPPPKIKYNIDVHREEPVFSGPKERSTDGQRGKKSLGKRLVVGGVWVAGISYALGVIAEFFTTGGMDGMGPKGL